MNLSSSFIYILFFILIFACSKKDDKVTIITEKNLETQMMEVYNQGMEEFEKGDAIYASKKFSEAELLYPQSVWAPRAALMSAYSHFSQGYYNYAINDLERFLIKYKNHPQTVYAFYLMALCHYNQIIDEKKDFNEILLSKKYFEIIINDFPNTEYASDSKYKLELINEIIASKEMYLARYYMQREKWIPAINRLKKIVNDHSTTIFIEEALYRLVELHYKLGLVDEAQKYAVLLGYNYRSSQWYEAGYKILNKDYSTKKIIVEKDKSGFLQKFKNIFQ